MSTINTKRAKILVFIMLALSSVATMGSMLKVQEIEKNEEIDKLQSIEKMVKIEEVQKIEGIENKPEILKEEIANINKVTDEDKTVVNFRDIRDKVRVVATGYTAGKESTGKDPSHPTYGITYSGLRVQRSLDGLSTIAADLNIFPLGTILYIPNYGYGIVADTGSAIKGHKIDLYFETVEDVYQQWGKQKVEVYVVKRGSGKLSKEVLEQYKEIATVNAPM